MKRSHRIFFAIPFDSATKQLYDRVAEHGERRRQPIRDNVRHWEIIADNLSKAGWSWGCVATVDREGRTIWIVDAHRDDGKRFVARSDEKLTAFVELERAICLHLLTEQI
jgi:hypothetical protein